jgi:ABC-type nitrate/sulfonate/bicarbonate transport system substrate-binding protein
MLLAACAWLPLSATAQAARTPVRIEVPNAHNLQFFTLWVALGAGLFQAEGLEPQVLVDSTPRNAGQLLLRGEADVAVLQPPMFLGHMAEGRPILLFASLLANEPINLVVRKDVAQARQLRPNAPLRERLEVIRGLRVGVAGEPPPRLRTLFSSAGLDATRDVELVIVRGPDQVQALAESRVDALFSHTPYLETALVKHGAVLLVETSSGEVPALADGQIHALATTPAMARDRSDLILAVTRAIQRAQRLIHSDLKATVDALIASGAAGPERELTEAIAAVYGPAVPRTPEVSLPGIERAATLYPAHPRAPDFSRVRASDFVAAEFAQRAATAAARAR